MTEGLEPVTDFLIGDMEHNEDTCYFCKAVPKQTGTNKTVAHIEADVKGYDGPLDNDAGELGKNLGKKPDRQDLNFTEKTGTLPSSVAAHHLIPGNASLADSKFLTEKRYLHVPGTAEGNIGYDINNAENGIWTPGCYAMYTPAKGEEGLPGYVDAVKGWKKEMSVPNTKTVVSKQEYAEACIRTWGVQFHDSHPVYSEKLLLALNSVFNKLEVTETIVCSEWTKNNPDKSQPSTLYSLLARLYNISTRAKTYVELSRLATDMYLSQLSLNYILKRITSNTRK